MIETRKTPWQKIEVWDEGSRRVLAINGDIQFLWNERENLISGLRCEYYNVATAASTWPQGGPATQVLIVGLGGGLIPWQLRRFFPEMSITCFELDPGIVDVASRLLPLASAGKVDVRVGDGRRLLEEDRRTYDYILLDAFLGSGVPDHMITRQFFDAAKRRLAPGGLAMANFHTSLNATGLLPRIEATIGSVFPETVAVELTAGTTLLVATDGAGSVAERFERAAARPPAALAEYTRRARQEFRPIAESRDLLTDPGT